MDDGMELCMLMLWDEDNWEVEQVITERNRGFQFQEKLRVRGVTMAAPSIWYS